MATHRRARSFAVATSASSACMRASLVAARFSRLSMSSFRISSSLRARRTYAYRPIGYTNRDSSYAINIFLWLTS